MTIPPLNVERLWAMDDGAVCLLVERAEVPRYEVSVVRGGELLRQNRLYARGSAMMLADTWRCTLASIRVETERALVEGAATSAPVLATG